MATIAPTLEDVSQRGDGSVIRVTWTPVTEADTCRAVQLPQHADRVVQVAGTFGGTSVAVQGTIDGTNFISLTDQANTTVAITSAGLKIVLQNAYQVKPVLTGGTSVSLTISMLCRMPNTLRT